MAREQRVGLTSPGEPDDYLENEIIDPDEERPRELESEAPAPTSHDAASRRRRTMVCCALITLFGLALFFWDDAWRNTPLINCDESIEGDCDKQWATAYNNYGDDDTSPPPPTAEPSLSTGGEPSPTIALDMRLFDRPILGEGPRWRRHDEDGILFNMRNSEVGASFDTACGMRIVPLPNAQEVAYHMVDFTPHVGTYTRAGFPASTGVSIVHHMDIFVCNDNMVQVPDDRECMNDSWLTDDGPCYALLWAYDKGALSPHRLPNDAGFRVGQGTPYTRLALQIHYLLPEVPSEWSSGGAAAPAEGGDVTLLRASELIDASYRDTSGIVVNLSPILRPHNAWSFEFMAYNMRIEPGATHLEYANRLPKAKVREILGTDLRYGNGSITLRQVHAHAHNHAVRVALLRMRDGEEPQTLYQIEPYCGYGDCQHFHNIPSQPTLMDGDELEFRCTYENHDRFVLGYGLSAMKEMCGPIIIYTPHDYGQRPRKTWYDHDDGRMRDDRFPEEEEDPEAGWTQSPMMNGHQEDFPTAGFFG